MIHQRKWNVHWGGLRTGAGGLTESGATSGSELSSIASPPSVGKLSASVCVCMFGCVHVCVCAQTS